MNLVWLFWGFAKVGALGWGGGPSIVPLLQAECRQNQWVTDPEFVEGLAVGNALPGPIATKMAAFVGWRVAGAPGVVVAILGVVLPTAILMVAVLGIMARYRSNPSVQGASRALQAVIVGMLAWTTFEMAPGGMASREGVVLALLAFVALAAKVHPAVVVVVAAAIGAWWWRA